jgi:hypothetical protein
MPLGPSASLILAEKPLHAQIAHRSLGMITGLELWSRGVISPSYPALKQDPPALADIEAMDSNF